MMLCPYPDAGLEESKSTTQKASDGAESYTGQAKNALGLGDSK